VDRQESWLESPYRWSGNPYGVCHATDTREGVARVTATKGGPRQRGASSRACGVLTERTFVLKVDLYVPIDEVRATALVRRRARRLPPRQGETRPETLGVRVSLSGFLRSCLALRAVLDPTSRMVSKPLGKPPEVRHLRSRQESGGGVPWAACCKNHDGPGLTSGIVRARWPGLSLVSEDRLATQVLVAWVELIHFWQQRRGVPLPHFPKR
jgi:hypothetical protein